MKISQVVKNSSLSRPETEILLSFLLKKSREFIMAHPETAVEPVAYGRYQLLEKERLAGWPIAYLTGEKEFYGLDFQVSPAVLTPRPETELMVEEIINEIKVNDDFRPSDLWLIDVGTGSGAIIITLARELQRLAPRIFKRSKIAAADISASALRLAGANARRHGLAKKIKFYRDDLLTPLKSQLKGRRLIIAANLPYLTPRQIKNSPSIKREPRLALDGGTDGLKYYRRLFTQLAPIKYQSLALFCEIDPGQTAKMIKLVKKHWPAASLKIIKDLAGRNRLVIIKNGGN